MKGSFFKQRRFVDDEDVAHQLAGWHDEVNTKRASRATRIVPAVRLAEEKPRLRPLPIEPAELALRVPVHVGPTGYVTHETHPYSMDPESMGLAGTLYLHRDRVRIVAGRFEATHPRKFGLDEMSTLPEHRAPRVAAATGPRAKRYMKREHLTRLGDHALEYITELVHRRPKIWIRDVERMHDMLERHADDAMRAAFARGLDDGNFGAEYIAHYLTTRDLVAQQ